MSSQRRYRPLSRRGDAQHQGRRAETGKAASGSGFPSARRRGAGPGAGAIDPAPNAEERLAAADEDGARERKRQEIIGLFADDLAAQVIVEGMMEGTRGEDLRALTDLDPTAYQSKRRLIRRRIEKRFKE